MTLGERIKTCRNSAGLSQEKVAELVGVSRQAVTKWESNQTAPSTENLFKLAEIFGTTVDLLLSKQDVENPSPAEEIYALYKTEKTEKAKQRKRNLLAALLTVAAYLAVYLIGRAVCGNFAESSFLGWLLGTDSKYYFFGWLTHQRLFWAAMAVSAVPALLGKYRFSLITFIGFVLGLFAGEVFGPYPAGAAYGHGHYGWLIWGLVFLASVAVGVMDMKIHKE